MVRTAFEDQTETREAREHSEGPVARTIEEQTAKVPSDAFLWAALGSMGVSAILQITGKKHDPEPPLAAPRRPTLRHCKPVAIHYCSRAVRSRAVLGRPWVIA